MIVDLEPPKFLEKLRKIAASAPTSDPVRVEVLRQVIPVYVTRGDHSFLQNAIRVIYQFRDADNEYLTREIAYFDDNGEADLGKLLVWPQLPHLGGSTITAANDGQAAELRNVRLVMQHRSGSV